MDRNNSNNPNNRNNNRPNRRPSQERQQSGEYYEKVVQVNRVSKKTTGGDKRSLSVVVVVGDRSGRVGVGHGKAADVQQSVAKATIRAKKNMIDIPLVEGRTIPHDVYIKLGAAKVLLKPAPKGTGVIAGGAVRTVVEAAGISDIVSKSLGTKNKASNVYATLEALKSLKVVTPRPEPKMEKKSNKKETKSKNEENK